jgi:hypothetical protein
VITAGVLHRNVMNTSSSTRTGPMSGLRYGARLRRGGPHRASGTGMMTAVRSINDKKAILGGRLFVCQGSSLQAEKG